MITQLRSLISMGVVVALVAACGFQPLHSQAYHDALAVDLSSLEIVAKGSSNTLNASGVTVVPRRYNELLQAQVQEQINPSGMVGEKLFHLDITYTEQDSSLFVNPDGTASRGNLIYSSSYTISRLKDAKVIASGTIQRSSTYNTSPSADYASYVSIEDARKRGIIALAQDYKLRLAALLPLLNNPAAAPSILVPDPVIPALQPVRSNEIIRP